MRNGVITVTASPEMAAAAWASIAYAKAQNPAEIAAAIAEQNTPRKLARTRARLATARLRRREAERQYFDEWFAK